MQILDRQQVRSGWDVYVADDEGRCHSLHFNELPADLEAAIRTMLAKLLPPESPEDPAVAIARQALLALREVWPTLGLLVRRAILLKFRLLASELREDGT